MKTFFVNLRNNIRKFFIELKCRLKSESPVWFKRIKKISIRLVGAGLALLLANSIGIPGFTLPAVIEKVCNYVVTFGIGTGLVSATACKNPPTN